MVTLDEVVEKTTMFHPLCAKIQNPQTKKVKFKGILGTFKTLGVLPLNSQDILAQNRFVVFFKAQTGKKDVIIPLKIFRSYN